MKNAWIYAVIGVFAGAVIGGAVVWKLVPPTTVIEQQPTPIIPTNTVVTPTPTTPTTSTPTSTCHPLTVSEPTANTTVGLPIHVKAVLDNRTAGCHWTAFEAISGSVELKDASGKTIAQAPLTATEDWMTDSPVDYAATLMPTKEYVGKATIVITEENPSDKPDPKVLSIPVTIVGSDF